LFLTHLIASCFSFHDLLLCLQSFNKINTFLLIPVWFIIIVFCHYALLTLLSLASISNPLMTYYFKLIYFLIWNTFNRLLNFTLFATYIFNFLKHLPTNNPSYLSLLMWLIYCFNSMKTFLCLNDWNTFWVSLNLSNLLICYWRWNALCNPLRYKNFNL